MARKVQTWHTHQLHIIESIESWSRVPWLRMPKKQMFCEILKKYTKPNTMFIIHRRIMRFPIFKSKYYWVEECKYLERQAERVVKATARKANTEWGLSTFKTKARFVSTTSLLSFVATPTRLASARPNASAKTPFLFGGTLVVPQIVEGKQFKPIWCGVSHRECSSGCWWRFYWRGETMHVQLLRKCCNRLARLPSKPWPHVCSGDPKRVPLFEGVITCLKKRTVKQIRAW